MLSILAPSTNCGPSDPFVPWSDLARDHQSETELGTSREQTQTFCSKPTFGAEQSHYCAGKPTIQSQSERFIFQLQQTGEREPERGENYKLDRFQKSEERNIKMTENNGDCLSRFYLQSVYHISPFSTCSFLAASVFWLKCLCKSVTSWFISGNEIIFQPFLRFTRISLVVGLFGYCWPRQPNGHL